MPLTQVDDHRVQAVALLLEQFKGKPAFEDLISALTGPLNSIETALFDLLNKRANIDASEGVQLDGVGGLVGKTRSGLIDADYRQAIRQEIALHVSGGTRDDLLNLNLLQVRIDEFNSSDDVNAEFAAHSNDDGSGNHIVLPDDLALEIFRLLDRGRSAGVYFTFEYGVFDALGAGNAPFRFDTHGAGFDGDSNFCVGTMSTSLDP